MKPRSFILRLAAFILLVIFSQKTGVDLLVHNFFHAAKQVPDSQASEKTDEINYACSCIDDFQMPFVEEERPILANLFPPLPAFDTSLEQQAVFTTPSYFSLRGPPSQL